MLWGHYENFQWFWNEKEVWAWQTRQYLAELLWYLCFCAHILKFEQGLLFLYCLSLGTSEVASYIHDSSTNQGIYNSKCTSVHVKITHSVADTHLLFPKMHFHPLFQFLTRILEACHPTESGICGCQLICDSDVSSSLNVSFTVWAKPGTVILKHARKEKILLNKEQIQYI